MFEVQVFIPVASNAGETFTAEHHRVFESHLLDVFNGFSRLPGLVSGGWRDAGVDYVEEHRAYVVILNTVADGGKIGEAVAFAKAHYGQLAIYVRYLGLSEIL